MTPLPDAGRLHSKEGERVLADNNQSDHHQFEHGEERSYVPTGEQEGGRERESLVLLTRPTSLSGPAALDWTRVWTRVPGYRYDGWGGGR